MNCIIIDDDPIILKQLSSFIIKSNLLNLKGSYSNPLEAYDAIRENNIDIIFLDIEMPEMSGLEYLDELKSKYQIIVISGDRKYALETFEYGVTDYLLKPIDYERFIKSVNKSIERGYNFDKDIARKRIFVKTNNKFTRIKFQDIVIINFTDNVNTVITNNEKIIVRNGQVDYKKLTEIPEFVQINEYCLVNKSKIVDVCDGELVFDDDYPIDKIEVSDSFGGEILKDIKQ